MIEATKKTLSFAPGRFCVSHRFKNRGISWNRNKPATSITFEPTTNISFTEDRIHSKKHQR